MDKEKNKRIALVDYLRAFAIIAVVVLHLPTVDFSLSASTPAYLFELAVKTAAESVAIPFFILLSGLSLAINYSDFSINRFYLKRAKTIVGPYLFFSVFYLIYRYCNNDDLTLLAIISSIFNGSSFYHLWFMILIPQYYLLYPVIIKIYKSITKKRWHWLVLSICLLSQIVWWIFVLNISAEAYYPEIKLMYSMVFMSNIFYFLLGIYIGNNFSYLKKRISSTKVLVSALVVFTGLVLVLTYYHLSIMTGSGGEILSSQHTFDWILGPAIVISGWVIINRLALMIEGKNPAGLKWFELIGKYSFGIYLIHPFFIQVIKANAYMHFGFVVPDAILFSLTITASFLAVYIFSLLPFGKYLVGVGYNKPRV
jgi:surface polysaccharide O-acyltransferase-like enzyme